PWTPVPHPLFSAPEGRQCPALSDTAAPPGLKEWARRLFQGLAPLANDCRPSGAPDLHLVSVSPCQLTGAAGRGRLYQARLHASISSGVRVRLPADRLSSSCSGRLAPTMAAVTPGWASTQATATCTSERPRGWKNCLRCSTASNWA